MLHIQFVLLLLAMLACTIAVILSLKVVMGAIVEVLNEIKHKL
jgi:Na+/proline symporter